MRIDDTENSYTRVTSYTDESGNAYNDIDWWNYGKELWCNMQGRYTSIVADLSDQASSGSYEMSLCNLGIMGTKYERLDNQVPTTEILLYNTMTSFHQIDVGKITVASSLSITNTISVKIR